MHSYSRSKNASANERHFLLNLVDVDLAGHGGLRRYGDVEAAELRHKDFVFSAGRRGNFTERLVVVWVRLLVDGDCAVATAASCVEAFVRSVENQIVDTFGDRKRLKFFASARVEDDDLAAAAADEKTMRRFVKSHGDIEFSHGDGPTGDQLVRLAVDYRDLIFRAIVDVDPRTGFFEGHGFERVAVDLCVGNFLASGSVDDAKHGKSFVRVPAAIVDIEIMRRRIVADGVRVDFEFHAFQQAVGFSVVDFQFAGAAVGDVNAVQILAAEDCVRNADAGDGAQKPAGAKIEDQDFVGALSSKEQPVSAKIDAEMIEAALNRGGHFVFGDKFQRFSGLGYASQAQNKNSAQKYSRQLLHGCLQRLAILIPQRTWQGEVPLHKINGN